MTIEDDGDLVIEENLKVKGEVNQTSTGTANLVPIAYETVSSDGSIKTGTGNFTVSNPTTGRYEITISGESYTYSSYVVSAASISVVGFIRTSSVSGKLLIFTYGTTGAATDMIFSL